MNRIVAILPVLAAAALVAVFAAFTAATFADSCTADGFTGSGVICVGSCDNQPGPEECKSREVLHEGVPIYTYCGCSENSEPACCHLVWYVSSPHERVRGNCPSCPASGSCEKSGSGQDAEAVCQIAGGT